MKKYFFLLFCVTLLLASCRQSIKWENVKIKDGLYVDSSSGEILDGKYISETPPEHAMSREDVILFEYSSGIPVGEWSDTYGGELIHSGEYLKEEDAKSKIQRLTKCKRVDLDLWKEADYQFLTIELIEPVEADTLTLNKVIEITKSTLFEKYKFKTIIIDSIGSTTKNYIYEYDIE